MKTLKFPSPYGDLLFLIDQRGRHHHGRRVSVPLRGFVVFYENKVKSFVPSQNMFPSPYGDL